MDIHYYRNRNGNGNGCSNGSNSRVKLNPFETNGKPTKFKLFEVQCSRCAHWADGNAKRKRMSQIEI